MVFFFSVTHYSWCITERAVYCLSCKRCNQQHIRETKRRLSDWFVEHLPTMRMKDFFLPVARHFNSDGQSFNDISVCTELFLGENEIRKYKEKDLIYTLIFRTCFSYAGLSSEMSCFFVNYAAIIIKGTYRWSAAKPLCAGEAIVSLWRQSGAALPTGFGFDASAMHTKLTQIQLWPSLY